jgi:hypothetical protein
MEAQSDQTAGIGCSAGATTILLIYQKDVMDAEAMAHYIE